VVLLLKMPRKSANANAKRFCQARKVNRDKEARVNKARVKVKVVETITTPITTITTTTKVVVRVVNVPTINKAAVVTTITTTTITTITTTTTTAQGLKTSKGVAERVTDLHHRRAVKFLNGR